MKTVILSIATLLTISLSVSNKTFAANKKDGGSVVTTMLTNVNNINKIEVHGNVQLYVTNGLTDQVKVYDSYYNQNALVQEQNGVLRISSYKNEKLVVWVTVNDLKSISAYDNASVESFGKFSALEFNLSLNNNATATFDMDCVEAKIAVNDNAKANIAGTATQTNMVVNQSATVNTSKFVAGTLVAKTIKPIVTADSVLDQLVSL